MTTYVHIPTDGGNLRTVGFYHPNGTWYPDSDHRSNDAAAARCHYLNGGNPAHDDLVAALRHVRKWLGIDLFGEHDVYRGRCAESIRLIDAALTKAGGV